MELRHLYELSEKINETFSNKDELDNIKINVLVSPTTLYGIDLEFYRKTHNGDITKFKHSNNIECKLNGVFFNINAKKVISK